MFKIFWSAAEASSDLLSSKIVSELKANEKQSGKKIDVFGIGGEHLAAAGMRVSISRDHLSVMGFIDVLFSLPKIFLALRQIKKQILKEKPDISVLVDYPGFHFRLARFLFLRNIPIIYLIPPKVWVWKKSRLFDMKVWARKVLCIFPFEVEIYRSNGVNCSFIGNPIIDGMPTQLTQQQARTGLALGHDGQILLLMPGSRKQEVKLNLPLMLDAALLLCSNHLSLRFVLVASDSLMKELIEEILVKSRYSEIRSRVHLVTGRSQEAMVASDVGLIKSGTSTLEAGLLSLPHAVIYRVSWFSEILVRYFVPFKGPFGLVNLALGKWDIANTRVKEFVGHRIPLDALVAELTRLLSNQDYRRSQRARLTELGNVFFSVENSLPAKSGATEILSVLEQVRTKK